MAEREPMTSRLNTGRDTEWAIMYTRPLGTPRMSGETEIRLPMVLASEEIARRALETTPAFKREGADAKLVTRDVTQWREVE